MRRRLYIPLLPLGVLVLPRHKVHAGDGLFLEGSAGFGRGGYARSQVLHVGDTANGRTMFVWDGTDALPMPLGCAACFGCTHSPVCCAAMRPALAWEAPRPEVRSVPIYKFGVEGFRVSSSGLFPCACRADTRADFVEQAEGASHDILQLQRVALPLTVWLTPGTRYWPSVLRARAMVVVGRGRKQPFSERQPSRA